MKLRNLLLACLVLLVPFVAAGQTSSLGTAQQFEYGDINYSWNDPSTLNLPNEIYSIVASQTVMISRLVGATRLAISIDGVGTNSVRVKVGDYRARTFDATADIDTTPGVEEMTISGGVSTPHEFLAADGPYKVSGTCPAGLSGTVLYFVEVVDVDTIAFHLTHAAATAAATSTRVDLGVAAVGTCTVGGAPAKAAANTADGSSSLGLMPNSQSTFGGSGSWPPMLFFAPARLTIATPTNTVVNYWFLP